MMNSFFVSLPVCLWVSMSPDVPKPLHMSMGRLVYPLELAKFESHNIPLTFLITPYFLSMMGKIANVFNDIVYFLCLLSDGLGQCSLNDGADVLTIDSSLAISRENCFQCRISRLMRHFPGLCVTSDITTYFGTWKSVYYMVAFVLLWIYLLCHIGKQNLRTSIIMKYLTSKIFCHFISNDPYLLMH